MTAFAYRVIILARFIYIPTFQTACTLCVRSTFAEQRLSQFPYSSTLCGFNIIFMGNNSALLRGDPLASDREPSSSGDLALRVIDGGMYGDREVDVEEGSIDTVDRR